MAIQTNRHGGPQADRATAQPHSRRSSHDGDITRHHGLATTRQHSGDRMIPVMRVTHADVDRLVRLDHFPGRRPLVASRNTPRLTRRSSARPASRGRTSRGMTRPTTIRRPRSSTICSLGVRLASGSNTLPPPRPGTGHACGRRVGPTRPHRAGNSSVAAFTQPTRCCHRAGACSRLHGQRTGLRHRHHQPISSRSCGTRSLAIARCCARVGWAFCASPG